MTERTGAASPGHVRSAPTTVVANFSFGSALMSRRCSVTALAAHAPGDCCLRKADARRATVEVQHRVVEPPLAKVAFRVRNGAPPPCSFL
jgi:hypothetical protein